MPTSARLQFDEPVDDVPVALGGLSMALMRSTTATSTLLRH